jgi:hypothetical protein
VHAEPTPTPLDRVRVDPARGWKPLRLFRGRRPNAIRVQSTWVAIVFGTELTTRMVETLVSLPNDKSSFCRVYFALPCYHRQRK